MCLRLPRLLGVFGLLCVLLCALLCALPPAFRHVFQVEAAKDAADTAEEEARWRTQHGSMEYRTIIQMLADLAACVP